MSLSPLILLDVVHENFETAADAAVIQIEAKAPYLYRLSASFMLPGIDARIQSMEHLVIAREQGILVNRAIAPFDTGVEGGGDDHDGIVHRRHGEADLDLQLFALFFRP